MALDSFGASSASRHQFCMDFVSLTSPFHLRLALSGSILPYLSAHDRFLRILTKHQAWAPSGPILLSCKSRFVRAELCFSPSADSTGSISWSALTRRHLKWWLSDLIRAISPRLAKHPIAMWCDVLTEFHFDGSNFSVGNSYFKWRNTYYIAGNIGAPNHNIHTKKVLFPFQKYITSQRSFSSKRLPRFGHNCFLQSSFSQAGVGVVWRDSLRIKKRVEVRVATSQRSFSSKRLPRFGHNCFLQSSFSIPILPNLSFDSSSVGEQKSPGIWCNSSSEKLDWLLEQIREKFCQKENSVLHFRVHRVKEGSCRELLDVYLHCFGTYPRPPSADNFRIFSHRQSPCCTSGS